MAWHVDVTAEFERDFRRLDRPIQQRVAAYLDEILELDDPRQRGKVLTGPLSA